MCLLFFYLNPNPKLGEYRLILINNRDEYYNRPTKPAHFWSNSNTILAGMDVLESREGGTWLGINNSGNIGCLLNVFLSKHERISGMNLPGRGYLVVDYLKGSSSSKKYLNDLMNTNVKYNNFHLLLFEFNHDTNTYCPMVYTNEGMPEELEQGFNGFGNNKLGKPFLKVSCGIEKLKTIVEKFGVVSKENQLIDELLNMMADSEKKYPDEVLINQTEGNPESMIRELSSIFVKAKEYNYGTRTTTIMLVNSDGKVTYVEKTMKEPIVTDKPEWERQMFSFEIKQ